MRKQLRAYPDYVSCALPALAPWPVPAANNGVVINGCVPFTNEWDPSRDPDLPPSAYNGLFTHPALPGVLLAKVSSMEELFRRGSSFVMGSTAPSQPIIGLVGRSAERVVLGDAVEIPRAMMPRTASPNFMTTRVMTPSADAWRSSFTTALGAGVTYSGAWGQADFVPLGLPNLSSINIADLRAFGGTIPSVADPSMATTPGFCYGRDEAIRFVAPQATPAANEATSVLMAVVTYADDGYITGRPLAAGSLVAQFTERYVVGKVSAIAAAYYPTWYAGLPSDLKEFAYEAFRRELDAVLAHPKDEIHMDVVTALVGRGTTVDVVAGHGAWYLTNNGGSSSGVCAPSLSPGAYPQVGVASAAVSVAEASRAAGRALLAHGVIADGVLKARDWPIVQYVSDKPVVGLAEVKAAAVGLEGQFTSAAIAAAAASSGWDAFFGTAQQQRVPTTKAPLKLGMAMGQMYATQTSGNAAIMLRELFRRTYNRMEQAIRSM